MGEKFSAKILGGGSGQRHVLRVGTAGWDGGMGSGDAQDVEGFTPPRFGEPKHSSVEYLGKDERRKVFHGEVSDV